MGRWLLLIVFLVSSLLHTYADNEEKRDSTNAIYESSLRSLINLDNTLKKESATATNIAPIPHNSDSVKTEEELFFLKTYSIYNSMVLPIQFIKPFPTEVCKIAPIKSIFENRVPSFQIELSKDPDLEEYFLIDSVRQAIHHKIIFGHPYLVQSIYKELPQEYHIKDIKPDIKHVNLLDELINSNVIIKDEIRERPLEIKTIERGHWIFRNQSLIHFTQNYISSNWYQGGESNLSVFAKLSMKANYISNKGWSLYNELEWRTSFYTVQTDTVHRWRTNDELFRIASLLAVKASEKWNYTVSYEFKTRFFNAFKANSKSKVAAALSPFESSLGIGMGYAGDIKKLNISGFRMVFSLFSYNFRYVNDNENVDVTSFGIPAGEKKLSQIGSRIDFSFNYMLPRNISWKTRLYYFTTYRSVESEWENNFALNINTYFTVNLFVHMRFDDKRKLLPNQNSYLQFREIFSLGWSYNW